MLGNSRPDLTQALVQVQVLSCALYDLCMSNPIVGLQVHAILGTLSLHLVFTTWPEKGVLPLATL